MKGAGAISLKARRTWKNVRHFRNAIGHRVAQKIKVKSKPCACDALRLSTQKDSIETTMRSFKIADKPDLPAFRCAAKALKKEKKGI